MGHKCYVSFKTENIYYKKYIQEMKDANKVDMIDKCLNEEIESDEEDYVMRVIREKYLSSSTVTLFLIGSYSNENLGTEEQRYIKRELQASLYNGKGNTRNGILGIVLPEMYDSIFKGSQSCSKCNGNHNIVKIDNDTTVKEFSCNYYIPTDKCAWSEDDRYCVLVKWSDFIRTPNKYIEDAFNKRTHPISEKVKVYPK